jgi:hypothetical protein
MGPGGLGEVHHADGEPEVPTGWQIAYRKGRGDMLLDLATMPAADRERLLARARAHVVPVGMAPWDNPAAADPRIKVHVDVTAADTPEEVAAKVDAALDDAVKRGGNPDDVRLDVQWGGEH